MRDQQTSTIANPSHETSRDWTTPLLWIAVSVVAVLFLALILLYRSHIGTAWATTTADWGQFGDLLGGVMNPVIGFITLVGLALTLRLQRQILTETQHETRRAEMQATNQREDEWFFQLLSMRTVMVSNLIALEASGMRGVADTKVSGPECFKVWVHDLMRNHLRDFELGNTLQKSSEEHFRNASEDLFARNTNSLLPYMRFMAEFLDQIHASRSDDRVQKRASLLASQLGEYEGTLLGCFGLVKADKQLRLQLASLKVVGLHIMTADRAFNEGYENSFVTPLHGPVYDALQRHLRKEFS